MDRSEHGGFRPWPSVIAYQAMGQGADLDQLWLISVGLAHASTAHRQLSWGWLVEGSKWAVGWGDGSEVPLVLQQAGSGLFPE